MEDRAADNYMTVMGIALNIDTERHDTAATMIDEMLSEMRQLCRRVELDQRFGFGVAHRGSISYRRLVSSMKKPERSTRGNFNVHMT